MAVNQIPQKAEDTAHASSDMLIPVAGVRQDTDGSPVGNDGDYQTFLFNPFGRLKVSTLPGDYPAITGNITAAQAAMNTPVANATVVADVSRASNVNMFVTGTFSGTYTFDGSIDGGTTWFGVQAVRTNANTVETSTGALAALPAYAWELSVNALTHVRIRCTTFVSGSAAWRILPGAYATEPIPAIQTHGVTQSGTWQLSANAGVTGSSIYYNAALTNTDVQVKATSARMYAWDFYNPNATDVYVQFWNALIANVTVGTTPPVFALRIPANSGRDYQIDIPTQYTTALAIAATTTAAGGTAPAIGIEARVEYA